MRRYELAHVYRLLEVKLDNEKNHFPFIIFRPDSRESSKA